MTARDLVIRQERPLDRDRIDLVLRLAFAGERVVRLVELIRASSNWLAELSFVALVGGEVVGYVLLSRVEFEGESGEVLTLSPLAVHPDHAGRGIGSALMRRALADAEQRGAVVVLEGDPDFYRRFGFEPASQHGIERPSALIPDAGFQVHANTRVPLPRGKVVYPPAFWVAGAVGPGEAV